LRLHGGVARTAPQKSFRLYFKTIYGATQFAPGMLFDQQGDPVQRLVVRSGFETGGLFANALAYDTALFTCVYPIVFEVWLHHDQQMGGKKMKPISIDLRKRIVEVYEEGQVSYVTVAERFRISAGSVKNFVKQWRATGRLEPKPAANGKTFLIDATGEEMVRGLIQGKTDLSQLELREQLAKAIGCVVSQPTISRTLRRLKVTRKKSRNAPKSSSETT
jgi:transposase